jgi:hypothetical protein
MRKFSYWLCFALVTVGTVQGLLFWALYRLGLHQAIPQMPWVALIGQFASPLPWAILPILPVPHVLTLVIQFVMLALVVRRLWLLFLRGEGVPESYAGVTKLLGLAGALSFAVATLALLISAAINAGSGVPAGMLALPATLLVPWAILLAEAFSLRRKARMSGRAQPA